MSRCSSCRAHTSESSRSWCARSWWCRSSNSAPCNFIAMFASLSALSFHLAAQFSKSMSWCVHLACPGTWWTCTWISQWQMSPCNSTQSSSQYPSGISVPSLRRRFIPSAAKVLSVQITECFRTSMAYCTAAITARSSARSLLWPSPPRVPLATQQSLVALTTAHAASWWRRCLPPWLEPSVKRWHSSGSGRSDNLIHTSSVCMICCLNCTQHGFCDGSRWTRLAFEKALHFSSIVWCLA